MKHGVFELVRRVLPSGLTIGVSYFDRTSEEHPVALQTALQDAVKVVAAKHDFATDDSVDLSIRNLFSGDAQAMILEAAWDIDHPVIIGVWIFFRAACIVRGESGLESVRAVYSEDIAIISAGVKKLIHTTPVNKSFPKDMKFGEFFMMELVEFMSSKSSSVFGYTPKFIRGEICLTNKKMKDLCDHFGSVVGIAADSAVLKIVDAENFIRKNDVHVVEMHTMELHGQLDSNNFVMRWVGDGDEVVLVSFSKCISTNYGKTIVQMQACTEAMPSKSLILEEVFLSLLSAGLNEIRGRCWGATDRAMVSKRSQDIEESSGKGNLPDMYLHVLKDAEALMALERLGFKRHCFGSSAMKPLVTDLSFMRNKKIKLATLAESRRCTKITV